MRIIIWSIVFYWFLFCVGVGYGSSGIPSSVQNHNFSIQKSHQLFRHKKDINSDPITSTDYPSTTASDQSLTTLPSTTESDQSFFCRNISVEEESNSYIKIAWTIDIEDPVNICVSIEPVILNTKECSSYTFCSINSTTNKIRVCPHQNYNITILNCTSNSENASVLYKTKPGVPSAPRKFAASNITDSSSLLLWIFPKYPHGPIDGYQMKYIEFFSSNKWKGVTINSTETSYSLNHLKPATSYYISLLAFNLDGVKRLKSLPVHLNITTAEGTPDPPENITVNEITSSSLDVRWSPSTGSSGKVIGYSVKWTKDNETKTGYTEKNSYVIGNLTSYTTYEITVSAWTKNKQGPWSSPILLKTDVSTPEPPAEINVQPISAWSFLITWAKPRVTNGPVTGYTLTWQNQKNNVTNETNIPGNVNQLLITDLNPWTSYNIFISAYNINLKKDSLSSRFTFANATTMESVPSAPRNLTAIDFTNESLTVEWLPPEETNGVILYYRLSYNSSAENVTHLQKVTETKAFVTRLIPYTEYLISVYAFTSAGQGKCSSVITLKTDVGVPSQPTNVKLQDIDSNSFYITWSPPKYPYGPINGYRIVWWENNRFEDVEKLFVDTNDTKYSIENLKPWTHYIVELSAYNINLMAEALLSRPWMLKNSTTAKTPEFPVITAIEIISSKSVKIQWDSKENVYPGPTNYSIDVWKNPHNCTGEDPYHVKNIEDDLISWNDTTTTIQNLKPFTAYSFQLIASNKIGTSRSNLSSITTTKSDVPSSPQHFRVNCNEGPTSVTLTWKSPTEKNGNVTEYRINYASQVSRLPKYELISVKPESTCDINNYSIQLNNLQPEVGYRFAIQARNLGLKSFGRSSIYSENCILPAGVPPIPQNESNFEMKESDHEEITIEWSSDMFSSAMGRIIRYSVIIAKPGRLGHSRKGEISNTTLPTWADFWEELHDSYQTTPEFWNPFEEGNYDPLNCHNVSDSKVIWCTIGLEKNCTPHVKEYCNGPLKPGKQYWLQIRGYTHAGFSETEPLVIMTMPLNRKTSIVLPLVVSSLFLVFITSIGGYYYYLKKRNRKPITVNDIMVLFRKQSSVKEATVSISSENKENTEAENKPRRPMNFTTFLEHVKIMSADSDLRFSQEYEELKKNSPRHPCTAASLEENRAKNRWMNIFPFDHSRVKLLPIDDDLGSDYINANYIPGFSSHREYIASQGPLPNTMDDFWRMIWEQNISMIVMVAECIERGKKKCEEYWPSDDECVYHADLQLRKRSVSNLPEYVIRIFDLVLGTRQRTVRQMHFTRWPDFGCPESPQEMINFVKAVRAHLTREDTGPILVHCSAGVGRTGTFIALDILLQQIMYHNCIDVYSTVLKMRNYRMNMVQTENQYIYIHKCIKELILEKFKASRQIEGDIYNTDVDTEDED